MMMFRSLAKGISHYMDEFALAQYLWRNSHR